MAEAIRMPLLSDTMKEGVIAAWHKKVGDTVKSDDVLAEVETDKATMEVTPYVEGTLLYIGVEKGQAAKVNDIIAIIGKPGEDYSALLKESGAQEQKASTPQETQPAQEQPAAQQQPAPAQPGAQQQAQPVQAQSAASQQQPAQQQSQKEQPTAGAASPQATPKPGDATVIRMPLLSDTMTEGKIVSWLKKVGDQVKSDDVLAEVETDKATMEIVPYVDGTLLHIGVEAGQSAKVNDIIAIVGKEGTDITPYLQDAGSTQPAAAAPQPGTTTGSAAAPAPATDESAGAQQQQSLAGEGERVKASPLARRIAAEKGIDIHQVKGSGDNGRIVKRDIDEYKPAAQQQAASKTAGGTSFPAAQPAVPGQEGYKDIPLSQMRKIIAQRLSESKFSAPHFYLRMTVTMDNAIEARKHINEVSPVKISFNDLIIKAAAMTLRRHPEVNSSWMGDFVRQNQHIHVGTAVAVDEGLIVPVIKFADQKSLSQIATEAGTLIEKARNKKLQPPEFTGNTFTISNLGMMDIDEFTAIINPPDSCILAVGKIAPTPVVEDGAVVVRQLLKLTLSCDHRVVDGAVGARFLQTLKAHLENPVTMLV